MGILKISTADKIVLLGYIRKNYDTVKTYWTHEKVASLEHEINHEVKNLAHGIVMEY